MNFQSLHYQFIPAENPVESPTMLLLHGTGGDETDFLRLGIFAGANLLGVRGNVLEDGTTTRFFRRTAEGVFDEADLQFRTHELAHFLNNVAAQEGFDLANLFAMGYSNGANMAGALLLLYPSLLKGAALWRPMLPFHTEQIAPSAGGKVLMISGQQDFYYRPDSMHHYEQLLSRNGFEVESHVLPTGHNLVRQDLALTEAWWQKVKG
ncbi:MAG: hypothetical protein U0Y10_06530 [Spirosomataceae bacterium]